jgi:protoporphyrinogen oxidase
MKIGIIGAGFTGLSAGYKLLENGHEVIIFEAESSPGGLALGFKEKGWEWTLEKHYHHWFTNDKAVLTLAKKLNHKVIIKRPKTSVWVEDKIYQFDSPKEVLMFPKLSLFERIRMGLIIGLLKLNPFWKPLEKINASVFLPKTLGKKGYKLIWEPLFKNKFGPFAGNVSLAWFWARIKKRTPSLAYPEGGFLSFANHLVEDIKEKGEQVKFNSEVLKVTQNKKVIVEVKENEKAVKYEFDKLIFTTPSSLFLNLTSGLPQNYKEKFSRLHSLGATNLILRLNKPFFMDNTYWLSVCDPKSPIMAIVEHTNYMDKKFYNDEYLVYLGNYMPNDSNKFKLNKNETLDLYDPYIKKINPNYKKYLIGFELFKSPFAQPVIQTNYSKIIPSFDTPLMNIYLANIDQVYPWDRGTNYAVELGEKIADYILNESKTIS